jgi:hypothetical protein
MLMCRGSPSALMAAETSWIGALATISVVVFM